MRILRLFDGTRILPWVERRRPRSTDRSSAEGIAGEEARGTVAGAGRSDRPAKTDGELRHSSSARTGCRADAQSLVGVRATATTGRVGSASITVAIG